MTWCFTHKSKVPTPKVKVPWLCSRSQPGIKVIIRDLRGHLLQTVTFLVFFSFFGAGEGTRASDSFYKESKSKKKKIFFFFFGGGGGGGGWGREPRVSELLLLRIQIENKRGGGGEGG